MASITIHNLDDRVKTRLGVRVVEHHRSMEEEAHIVLGDAVNDGQVASYVLAKFGRECGAASSWGFPHGPRCANRRISPETPGGVS